MELEMNSTSLSIVVAWSTWVGFAAAMRYYFRGARQRNAAKSLLTISAFACSLAQLLVLCLMPPPAGWGLGLGLACYAFANLVFWSALWVHGKARPAFAFIDVKPSTLTRRGPYRLIRHPIYSAYLVAWLAGSIITGQPWLLATVAWMWLLYYVAARKEEKCFAQTSFRQDYDEYQNQTGMFFPRLLPRLHSGPSNSSRNAA
jgi:protein-S-isoprenylcysteine O-methyltransferase Ste14